MMVADLSSLSIGCLAVYAVFIAAFCLLGLIRAFDMETRLSIRLYYIGVLLLSLFFMQGFDTMCVQLERGEVKNWWMAERMRSMPVWLVLLAFAVLTACVTGMWIVMERQIRKVLSPASLQEGLDFMPDGICFFTEEGIPLLVNQKMQHISYEALGTEALDMKSFRQRLEAENIRRGNTTFLHLQDGSIWDIRYNVLSVQKTQVHECIAYDITEQYRKSREIEKRNEHLAAVNAKIREYNQNLDSIIREREILAAKIRIHDDVGRSLLALRSYLTCKEDDRKSLIDLWRFMISALKREEVSRDTVDRMEALIQAGEAVGVKLRFFGEIPKEPAVLEVAAAAVHECLTNTVKHADGSELTVHTEMENGAVLLELRNNGKPPVGTVEEKGGLLTLRAIVEQYNGRMEILSQPEFVLKIELETISYEQTKSDGRG